MLGDEQLKDSLKLFFAVKERGGADFVTANGGWDVVSEAVGFDSRFGSSLNLIYVKYLDALQSWLKNVLAEAPRTREGLRSAVGELRAEVDGLFLEASAWEKEEEEEAEEEVKVVAVSPISSNLKKNQYLSPKRESDRRLKYKGGLRSGNKRKREELVGMLDWVLKVAKNPRKSAIRGKEKLYLRALSARNAMFCRKAWKTNVDMSALQNGQRMHCIPLFDFISHLLPEYQNLHRVLVGPFFQAKVPPWTGKVSATPYDSDDQKWLGTPIWPLKNQLSSPFRFQVDPIGKGRQESCKCECPSSVECVRLHVKERRFRLKHELGSAFDSWRFDCMGEEVALSWTVGEARKFKEIMFQNPLSLNKDLWDQLHMCFPQKGRKNLVRYYFNVFVLACRRYQNRETPDSIDSDDDETEFVFL